MANTPTSSSSGSTSIDLSNASDADLQNIKNDVMARLAGRAASSTVKAAEGYDRHGSGHSRSSPPGKTLTTTAV
jgi:hypothetical protein